MPKKYFLIEKGKIVKRGKKYKSKMTRNPPIENQKVKMKKEKKLLTREVSNPLANYLQKCSKKTNSRNPQIQKENSTIPQKI